MKLDEIISRDPDVMGGTAVFAGTRVPLVSLLVHLKAGDRLDDFLDGFPTVSRAQAEGLLDLAGRVLAGGAVNGLLKRI